MEKLIGIFLVASLAIMTIVATPSCSKNEEDEPTTSTEPTTINLPSVEINAQGDTVAVNSDFSSDFPNWWVEKIEFSDGKTYQPSFAGITTMQSTGNYEIESNFLTFKTLEWQIKVAATPNNTGSTRWAIVQMMNGDGIIYQLEITQ